ncbi:OmpA family protein [uncultured Flavobacterium sp.]|uniref:OmpA family protein n=1 Tax=uncultured Flavobacterium sp. TaxID=165435 RepID=UPI0030EDD592|tara:strand:- start:6443 stop:7303 length:861 start_codon:yes stop_codon:yes gene_type:complete
MKSFLSIFLFFFIANTFAQEQFVVYFNSDKFELTKSENKKLNEWMNLHIKDKIVAINGYTDEDGTSGYNDTLSKKRVNYVFDIIKEKVPFREDFESRSYGENFNQSKNKAENRKVTIYYIEEKDLARENEILGIKEEIVVAVDSTSEVIEETISDDAPLEERIAKTKEGKTLILKDINFYHNTFGVMSESRPTLYDLVYIMGTNPRLVIQVQGHVCCNTDVTDSRSIMLSRERAKAVKLFLVAKGIPAARVSFQGFGSSMPLYPIPEQNEEERIANRRVEILIVKK